MNKNRHFVQILLSLLGFVIVVLAAGTCFTDSLQKKLIILTIAFILLTVLVILALLLKRESFILRFNSAWSRLRSHAIDVPEYRVNARIGIKKEVQLNPSISQYFISFVFDTGYSKVFEVPAATFSRLTEGQYGLLIFREKGQYCCFDGFRPYGN